MNERILELAEQSEITQYVAADNKYLERFAELIIWDMLGLLEQYSRDSFPEDIMDDFDKGYQAGLHTAQKAVKEHFGVSE